MDAIFGNKEAPPTPKVSAKFKKKTISDLRENFLRANIAPPTNKNIKNQLNPSSLIFICHNPFFKKKFNGLFYRKK